MKFAAALIAGFSIFASLCAADSVDETASPILQVGDRPVEVRFAEISNNMLQVSVLPARADGTSTPLPPDGLLHPTVPFSPVQLVRKLTSATQPVTVGEWQISASNRPLTLRVKKDERLLQEIVVDESGEVRLRLGDGPLLGLGEGGSQFDRRGADLIDINGQATKDKLLMGARVAAPFLIGTSGWAVYLNTPRGEFDLRGTQAIVHPNADSLPGMVDLYVVDAREPAAAMREFVRLTGRPALPPRWALGYMQSHRTLVSTEEMIAVADTFRDKKLPCDALIYLGTGFCPQGWNRGHDSLEFNPKLFTREPAQVLADLHARHFNVVLHVVPPHQDLHGTIPPAPDEVTDEGEISRYWARHRQSFAAGADGWWPDDGDWFNVSQRLARHRMYFDGPLADRPNVRPWSLHRNGFPGMAPYGGWIWSGDVAGKWETLAAQVRVGLNTSLSLTPYWGTDTGGFFNTEESSGELFVRWFQFSSFTPSFRSHGIAWHTRLPWGWNTGNAGPLEGGKFPLPESVHDARVEPICREFLNLRYQLMPYTYTLAREAHDTGLPLMRALWLHYPLDAAAVARGDEFLWGRDLLVAPVLERGATERHVYLPPGDWYDWETNEKLAGGREVTRPVELRSLPLFVRAGAIVPLDPVRQFTAETVSAPTTLRIYRGADGEFTLYDDDGKSLDYLNDTGTTRMRCEWRDADRSLKLSVGTHAHGSAVHRNFEVVLLPDGIHRQIEFAGSEIEVRFE